MKKNIHVFCEKPPAKNYEELKSLKKILVKNKNLKLKYGFNHRYHGSVKKAENLIDSKIYGKIINFRAIYGKSKIVTFGKNEWRANRKFSGGGILIDQGIHLLDLITKFGGKFEKRIRPKTMKKMRDAYRARQKGKQIKTVNTAKLADRMKSGSIIGESNETY